MGMPERYDDSFVAGDTYKLLFNYKDSDGIAIDLTDYTVNMHVKKSVMTDDVILEKTYVIDAIDGPVGKVEINLDVNDTNDLSGIIAKSSYVYDVQLTSISGDNVKTVIGGIFDVYKGVTIL